MFAPTHIKVFLGSPSDVKDDRDTAVYVLKRITETPAYRGRVTVQTYTYDDEAAPTAMPATTDPQSGIVKYGGQPGEYDFTIIILWTRMGTRLPASLQRPGGGVYESGTQWEYEDARSAGKDVFVYLRTDPPSPAAAERADAQHQLQKLRRFVDSFQNEDGSLAGFVNQYRSPPGLEEILDRHMQGVIRRLVERAERRRKRTLLGALAGLVLVATAAVTPPLINAYRPRATFTGATDCELARDETERKVFMKVDYEVANARNKDTVYVALYEQQDFSHPLVKRALKSRSGTHEVVDVNMNGQIALPRWARIEVAEGSSTRAVSPPIQIECLVSR